MKRAITTVLVAALAPMAIAADLPSKSQSPTPYAAPPAAVNWTGFYLGLNTGLNFANFGSNYGSNWGGVFGGTAGYNAQIGQAVVGVEGDYAWSWASANSNSPFGATKASMTSIATLRARLGLVLDRSMIYGTFGYGGAQVKETAYSIYATQSQWRNGLALGAGYEYAFTNNISAKVEDVYTWYGSNTYFAGTIEQNHSSPGANLLRVGLNYKF
jgi:outer membrane immunogenic protein